MMPGIRAIAAELALRADQDLDAVGDLRLAVEELCSTMANNTDPDQTMTTRLRVTPDRAEIHVDVPLPHRRPAVSPLSLRILRVLCDSVDYWTDTVDDHAYFHAHVVRLVE
jgi:serine/threonine-protein kinase RsbW